MQADKEEAADITGASGGGVFLTGPHCSTELSTIYDSINTAVSDLVGYQAESPARDSLCGPGREDQG